MTNPALWCRDKKTPLPQVEEELRREAWCLLKNEEESDLFLPSYFSFDYETVAH